jgi:hypothetical protein
MKILFSPLGLTRGSLFSAIVLAKPDHVVILTSQKGAEAIEDIVTHAKDLHPHFTWEYHILQDPFTGFIEGRTLARKIGSRFKNERLGKRNETQEAPDEYIANLAGGTTALQDAIKCLADIVRAQEIAVIDKRPIQEQQANPFVVGEWVEVPPMHGLDSGLPRFTSRFEEALVYATCLHAKQRRKGTNIPYIAHLLSVAALVLEDGGDEDEAIAALLHDAIEDQGGSDTREEIRRRFGDRVVHIVDGCTDAETIPKPPWHERKQKYIDHIPHASPEVRRVSVADKLHNARSLLADFRQDGDNLWNRFKGGREGTLWYYRALVQAFRKAGSSFMVEELDRVVSELERLVAATK